jgi:hypothetical protein
MIALIFRGRNPERVAAGWLLSVLSALVAVALLGFFVMYLLISLFKNLIALVVDGVVEGW